jgi:hypothetical protein
VLGRTRQMREPKLVRKGGVEPPRPFGHRILSPARLPVPPLSRRKHANLHRSTVIFGGSNCWVPWGADGVPTGCRQGAVPTRCRQVSCRRGARAALDALAPKGTAAAPRHDYGAPSARQHPDGPVGTAPLRHPDGTPSARHRVGTPSAPCRHPYGTLSCITFVSRISVTAPLPSARELMARRAGTRQTRRPAARTRGSVA